MSGHFLNPQSLIMIAVTVFSSIASGQVLATERARDGVVQFAWETPDSPECGMSCLYEKASENLSTEALYLVRKLRALEQASNDEKLRNLSGFCIPNEHANACFARYRDFVLLRLRKIRGAVGANAVANGALESGNPDAVVAKGANEVRNPLTGRYERTRDLPQIPAIPTFEELQAQRLREVARRPELGREPYAWDGRIPYEPSESDFVMYCNISKRPTPAGVPTARVCGTAPQLDPTEDTILVPDTSCGRPICIDQAAFQQARQYYQDRTNDFQMTRPYAGLAAAPAQFFRQPTMDAQTEGDLSVTAYNEARAVIIKRANEVITGAADDGPQPEAGSDLANAVHDSRGPAAQTQVTGREMVIRSRGGARAMDIYVRFSPRELDGVITDIEQDMGLRPSSGTSVATGSGSAGAPSTTGTALAGGSVAGMSSPYGSGPVDLSGIPTQILP